jgi:hypothetical protein
MTACEILMIIISWNALLSHATFITRSNIFGDKTDCLKLQSNCLRRFQPVPVLGLQPLEDQPHYHLAPDHLGQTNTRLDLQSCSFDPHFLMADMNQKVPEFQIFPELRRSKKIWKETMSEDCGQRWTGPQSARTELPPVHNWNTAVHGNI